MGRHEVSDSHRGDGWNCTGRLTGTEGALARPNGHLRANRGSAAARSEGFETEPCRLRNIGGVTQACTTFRNDSASFEFTPDVFALPRGRSLCVTRRTDSACNAESRCAIGTRARPGLHWTPLDSCGVGLACRPGLRRECAKGKVSKVDAVGCCSSLGPTLERGSRALTEPVLTRSVMSSWAHRPLQISKRTLRRKSGGSRLPARELSSFLCASLSSDDNSVLTI